MISEKYARRGLAAITSCLSWWMPVACAVDHGPQPGDKVGDQHADSGEDASQGTEPLRGDADAGSSPVPEDPLAFRDDFERPAGLLEGETWIDSASGAAKIRAGRLCFERGDRFRIDLPPSGRHVYLQLDLIHGDVDGLEFSATGADPEAALFRISEHAGRLSLGNFHASSPHPSTSTLTTLQPAQVVRLVGEFDTQRNGYVFQANPNTEQSQALNSSAPPQLSLRTLWFHNWSQPAESPTCIDNVYVGTRRPSSDPFGESASAARPSPVGRAMEHARAVSHSGSGSNGGGAQ